MTPNSYETEAGTAMLATQCLICGRPLRDPESLERGVGPYCAQKRGMFAVTGDPDETALAAALSTAPPAMAESVSSKMPSARLAVSAAIHAAGRAWELRSATAGHYIGSAIEIANALGYHGTATALSSVFIEGVEYDEEGKILRRGKQRGIVVEKDPRGQMELRLPYLEGSIWRQTKAALKSAGVRTSKDQGGKWHDTFPPGEREWLLVLNAMVDTLGGMLGILPNGETFIVPSAPVPVPAPPGPAAGAPTTEKLPPPPPPVDVHEGETVEMHDGRVMVVARMGLNSKGPWLGLMTPDHAEESLEKYGYLFFKKYSAGFCGLADVKQKRPTAPEIEAVAEDVDGSVVESAAAREIPEALLPWQREGVLWLNDKQSGILAFEQGTGKTPTALAAMDAPILIVVPASLRENWKREANKWRPDLVVAKVEKAAHLTPDALKATCIIVSYEAISDRAVQKALRTRGFRTIVSDESQILKELRLVTRDSPMGPRTVPSDDTPQRAAGFYLIQKTCRRRIFLTGTPMVNGRPYELWPLLHMVDPTEWADQREYWDRYCDPKEVFIPGGGTHLNVNGHDNLAELRDRIHGHYLLRRTKEVLGLPEKKREYISVGLTEDMAEEYRQAAAEFLVWVRRRGGPKAALRAARAEVIARLTALRRIAAIGKIPVVIDHAVSFLRDTGRPLIIMGHHSEALTAIESALTHLGYRVGMITGDVTGRKRERALDEFQSGWPTDKPVAKRKFLDVLVCSITAAGVGLTLTRAQDMMIMERVWRPFDLVQAEDRIHRYGQSNKCIITYFDAAGTIDDMLAKLLAEKAATAAEVIDGADLDEDAAQDKVVESMFGSLTAAMTANQTGDAESAVQAAADWMDPEIA